MVGGRRWRRADPSIPAPQKERLLSALGRARNAVRVAKRAGDEAALTEARHRVQLAKTGLGERGTPWWEQSAAERAARVRDALAALEKGETAGP